MISINKDVVLGKWFSTEVLDNYEQTETTKVGVPIVIHKVSYKTTIYDKTTKIVKNVEQLVVKALLKPGIEFKINDIIEINGEKWKITTIEQQDPFQHIKTFSQLTLQR